MKPFTWMNRRAVFLTILGLVSASCAMQKSRVLLTTNIPPLQQDQTITTKKPKADTRVTVHAAYGKLPLSFEANKGQSDKAVKFRARGSNYNLFLTAHEATLALRNNEGNGETENQSIGEEDNRQSAIHNCRSYVSSLSGPTPIRK